ncbi:DUF4279 domain-containing protein [Glycomyces algeriensis]|uniref:DUF4279 domain-containing protein n=1 Tax=Glycomyces algeriensis TaxID=256037 RepID=A0A9W6GAW1_9ACTN|nr:DUF4279 domain-containing protein [Glycomyces algeriensis]MDA1364664.1 DUF4279 domain-containing protein [Glycomyces algeriensis]MDR7350703.1 hypothetical protein [Glycomyces algeriensis]GLI43413.1 hypothetical protein GALLR39Z86_32630 [Glycomyces algeriensis]
MGSDIVPRLAALVAWSEVQSVEEMSKIAGIAPDISLGKGQIRSGSIVSIPAKESSWKIREFGDREVPLEEVIDRLFVRVFRMRESFIALREAGCEITLELVQWMSESDPHGPGFHLDAGMLHFLAEIDAEVDVDLYLD